MERNWKPWSKDCYFKLNAGRYWLKLKNGEVIYDDFKNRRQFGWGFSGYAHSVGIIEYAEF